MTKTFEIVYRDPAELIPYEMNAKKHDEQQIRDGRSHKSVVLTSRSLSIKTMSSLLAMAAAKLRFSGLKSVPVIVRDDLSDEEVKAKRLEDNRLASIDYDAIKLQKELESLVFGDVEVFGFDERELNVLVGSMTEEMDTGALVMDLGRKPSARKKSTPKSVAKSPPKRFEWSMFWVLKRSLLALRLSWGFACPHGRNHGRERGRRVRCLCAESFLRGVEA